MDGARRFLATLLAFAQVVGIAGGLVLLMPSPALALTCATPGKDLAGGTVPDGVNSYWVGAAAVAAGATTIPVAWDADFTNPKAIASGDLLLVIQTAGGTLNTANTSSYGQTSYGSAGKYEFVKAASALAVGGTGTLTIVGTNAGGLINAYTNSGNAMFQVIRVPQYTTATLSSSTSAGHGYWDGQAGGIIALDVSGTLTLGGTVSILGQGYHGGGGLYLVGPGGASTDYVAASPAVAATAGYGASKGGGTAGDPRIVATYNTTGSIGAVSDNTFDGLVSSSGGMERGAPGPAGGGGNSAIVASNTENSGGGGGANGGAGGIGGNSQTANSAIGGLGGLAISPTVSFLTMGAGGGAGSSHSVSPPATAYESSGGSGGGMIFIRAGTVSGTGTLSAAGAAGQGSTLAYGGGGGGAGGTIVITSTATLPGTLTLAANGGVGGNTATGTATASNSTGPGGGGGGGFIVSSSGSASTSVTAGAAGTTLSTHVAWGAGAGSAGTTATVTPTQIPGISSGAECSAATATMTIANPAGQNVTPSSTATDTFTLTNTTAAGTGTFQVTAGATFGGTATGTTLLGYVLAGATSGTCSTATPCTLAVLNGAGELAVGGVAASTGTMTVGVVYTVSGSATAAQTIQPSISVTIAVSGDTTSTAAANATFSDTVLAADARLDVQTSVVGPTSAGSVITWTVTANNGGAQAGLGLASAKTALGVTYNGVVIFVPVPIYTGTPLVIQSAPATPVLGASAQNGDSTLAYYNTAACSTAPTSGWVATTAWATAKCIALYVQNSGTTILPSAPTGSGGAGVVTAATAQITFSFTTNQPTGTGSNAANSVTLLASGVVGGSNTGTPILGQGVAANTNDASTASLINGIQTNVTSSSGTIPPGGASNSIGSQAFSSALFTGNGPVGANAATGSYDGVVAVNNSNDFTAVSFTPVGANLTNSGTVAGTPVGNTLAIGPTTINVPNELDYTAGASGGTLTLTGTSPTTPAGWTMRLCPDSAGAPSCATTAVWTVVGAAVTSPTAASSTLTLTASQHLASMKYWAVYTAPSGVVAFTRYNALVHATDGTLSNDTHDALYAGFVPLTRSVTVSTTGCPSGVTPPAGGVCPGGKLLLTIDYRNIVAGSTSGTEPESAFPETAAGTLVLTENGAYLANTNGLNEMLIAGANGTTTFGDSTANATFTGNIIGSTSFADTVGGANFQLVPTGFTGTNKGQQGTFTFRVIVK